MTMFLLPPSYGITENILGPTKKTVEGKKSGEECFNCICTLKREMRAMLLFPVLLSGSQMDWTS
jgi:hypothetical protein